MLEPLGQLIASRYRVTERLGEGGMGVVYTAIDEQLHRAVAVKFLPPGPDDRDRLARFQNEARALSSLNHPNIVTIYEVGTAAGAPFIAMELVEGQTLRDRLRSGPLPMAEALDIVLQAARAISAAHARGLVHRDIKPENVMVRRDGYVKVLDFGLAALRPTSDSTRSLLTAGAFETVAFGVAGTPAYMAPEQLEGTPADARSDVFALGVLLCETITGSNPFARPTLLEIVSAIGATPAPAASGTAALPPAIRAPILKALQKSPADRYPSASEFASALQQLQPQTGAPASRTPVQWRRRAIVAIAALALVAAAGWMAYQRSARRESVRTHDVPEIARLAADERAAAAFPLIARAEQTLPGDPEVQRAIAAATRTVSIDSDPEGASVEVKDYLAPDEPWLPLGTTPLKQVRIPKGYLRWHVLKPGVADYVSAPFVASAMHFPLAAVAGAPRGMLPVDGGPIGDFAAFLGWLGPYNLPAFYVDRLEVTNRDYQAFVDAGGYGSQTYWQEPVVRDGRVLPWADAMALFRDSTGRPGPATWEAGHYRDGQAEAPVTGVSWYEAAAYAAFAKKSLPVIIQRNKLAPSALDRYLVRFSNFSERIAPAGASDGPGPYGTLDMVGNAREWYWNDDGRGQRYILGRQASSYAPEALSPLDRSPLNGFRCVRNAAPVPADARAPRPLFTRDFSHVTPVSDEVFRAYRAMYAYDKGPLHASVEAVADPSPDWTREKVTLDAAYGGQRLVVHLFLPKLVRRPLQAVVFFPSARVNQLRSSDQLGDLTFVDYIVKSGRAVAYPVYLGFYERATATPPNPGPTFQREEMVAWAKDVGRTIDYLDSRADIDGKRIGYVGVSQGAAWGVIFAALEDRLKALVLLDGGFFQFTSLPPGLDQVDFAPRITQPVLMVNGRYDAAFPVDAAQDPLFRMLGTREPDKQHVVFETPHDVRLNRDELIRDVLGWYDKYLGRVN